MSREQDVSTMSLTAYILKTKQIYTNNKKDGASIVK